MRTTPSAQMKSTFVGILLFSSFIISCGYLYVADVNKFRKGMSPDEVQQIASVAPVKEFPISIESFHNRFFAKVYKIAHSNLKSTYFVVFLDNKLMYWGFPYEFERHSDPLVNQIGRTTLEIYER